MKEGKTVKKKSWRLFILFGVPFLLISCTKSGELVVLHQVTGPVETNCYLLYDAVSKEAALIDVGGSIDKLVSHIKENELDLKYIFASHVHMDHVEGVPQIKKQFPDALIGLRRFPQHAGMAKGALSGDVCRNDAESRNQKVGRV